MSENINISYIKSWQRLLAELCAAKRVVNFLLLAHSFPWPLRAGLAIARCTSVGCLLVRRRSRSPCIGGNTLVSHVDPEAKGTVAHPTPVLCEEPATKKACEIPVLYLEQPHAHCVNAWRLR